MPGFKDIIGNELIKTQLSEAIALGRLSHAYMFVGERGMGKKLLARDFLLSLFCDNKSACLCCPSCKKILSGDHPDVIWLTPEKPDAIKIGEIREQVIDTVSIKPYLGDRKIYIIPNCETMNVQAQNALLKVLEEPPEYVSILMLCNDESLMLETISSRVVKIKLKPVTDSSLRAYLKEHFPDTSESRLDIAVAFAKGNIGRASELISSADFSEWYHETTGLCKRIKRMDSALIASEAKRFVAEYKELYEILDLILLWYRDLMMFKVTKDIGALLFKEERSAMMELAPLYSYEGIENIIEGIETAKVRLRANVNPELALELLFLRMRDD